MTLEVKFLSARRDSHIPPGTSRSGSTSTPDHLDRYPNMEAYRRPSSGYSKYQTAADFRIVKLEDIPAVVDPATIKSHLITFSASRDGGDFDLRDGVIHFRGAPCSRWTRQIGAASTTPRILWASLAVGYLMGLAFERTAARSRLIHRMPQPVRNWSARSIKWTMSNGLEGTNIDAPRKSARLRTRPVVLIAGGKDKDSNSLDHGLDRAKSASRRPHWRDGRPHQGALG